MTTSLVIVESPKKARTIKKILGPEFIVRATAGHIVDLRKGKGGDIGVDIENGFTPKYQVIPDKKDSIAAITDAARKADIIYLASDKDREGEAIAFHVADVLSELNKPMKRVEFDEITKTGVKKGMASPRDLDGHMYEAQQARRVLDRIVGFMVSPYLMKKLNDFKLSAGRVQSVALRLIVEREQEIQTFVPEEYWNIFANLATTTSSDPLVAKYSGQKVATSEDATRIKKELSAASYVVEKVDAKRKERTACAPLTTAKLQQDAAGKYRFSGTRTMKAAQALYESGHVTYIRSDSVRCSPESIVAVREWLEQAGFDVPAKPNQFKNKNDSQDAHEAIRPTDVSLHPDRFTGSEDEAKIYKLIWCRFVGSQMKPAVYDTVDVSIKADKHPLKAEGKVEVESGWLEICRDIEKKTKDVVLPLLKKGDKLVLVPPNVTSERKKTSPKPRYTDGTINQELEKRGIGRPATYAAIIEKISNRKYLKREKAFLVPTELGMEVIEDLKQFFSFMEYKYTADMEDKLDHIAEGKQGYLEMMTEFWRAFQKEFKRAKASGGKNAGFPCPECGDQMIVRHSDFGYFAGCINFPDCTGKASVRMEGEKVVKVERKRDPVGVKCPECGDDMYKHDGRFGPIHLCVTYPKCKGKRKIPTSMKCPKCGDGAMYVTVFNGEPKLACMEYPNCKNIIDIPEGMEIDWVPPEQLDVKINRKVDKALKAKP